MSTILRSARSHRQLIRSIYNVSISNNSIKASRCHGSFNQLHVCRSFSTTFISRRSPPSPPQSTSSKSENQELPDDFMAQALRDYKPPTIEELRELQAQAEAAEKLQQEQDSLPPKALPESVAIVGGGITGLAATYYLANYSPTTQITLYEGSSRFGGWLQSTSVDLPDGGQVIFEQGPRTLRPMSINGLVTLDLIRHLELDDELILVPKSSPAAKNRYIYYNNELVKLPNSILAIFQSVQKPLLKGLIGSVLKEPFRKRRDPAIEDESVGSFISRRLSPELSNNLFSAVLHGIYAGDVDKLSAQMLLTTLYRNEAKYGGMLRGQMKLRKEEIVDDQILRKLLTRRLPDLIAKMKDTSVYSFKGGIETLSKKLVQALKVLPNVTLKSNTKVQSLRLNEKETAVELKTDSETSNYSYVLSTLFAPHTASILPTNTSPTLATIKAVTVMVVNLYYPKVTDQDLPNGFGYLIPKSVPESENPERALGVIFDSDTLPTLDTSSNSGTKFTVMLGGHWWSDRSPADMPTKDQGITMAKAIVKRHLKIQSEPIASHVSLQKDCIPQYEVGHAAKMRQVHEDLITKMKGKVAVTGNSYEGVGMNDCVRNAREQALNICENEEVTGLENFAYERLYVQVR